MAHRKTRPLLSCFVLIGFIGAGAAFAQSPEATLFKDLKWRNIGPANMQGRVTDIEALEDDYRTVLVASASGGVFKSVNAGTTWEPIFDNYGSASMGDVAISRKDPNLIWVGTGESCVRNSVGWGDGVYKSTDGCKTFTNVGLRESHHISEVLIHPDNPDTDYVAAQGHLWGHNDERGLYRTRDGGKSWTKLGGSLPDDGKTGCSDVKMDPENPKVLYAAFWERLRKPWRFDSGGPNGGIFKSTDGGDSWTKLTGGLPDGPTGKIGLAVYKRNPQIVMAIIEHGFRPNQRSDEEDYRDMSQLGTGIYRSEDGGKSWRYVNRYNNRPFYYSHIYINPSDDQLVYVLAGSAMVSTDGGKTLTRGMRGISGDFHALWIDPHNKDRYYVGNDKGTSLTHDQGRRFLYFDNMAIGQFYSVTCDMRDPYYVYGGLQDNGIWGGPSNSRNSSGILTDHWFKFHSGDGFHVQIDPTDWTTVYSESQGGAIRRNHAVFRQVSKSIRPNERNVLNFRDVFPDYKADGPGRGRRGPFRNNWSTPYILSPHNPHTLYYGAQYLLKSVNQGESWTIISPNLTTEDPERTNPESGGLTPDVTGAETNATLLTISESPIKPGLIWVGTDDGMVHVTQNDGREWTEVTDSISGVPAGLWISRVRASHHDPGTAYVTIDGHRSDNFHPYVFKTTDYGRSWSSIAGNLPEGHSVYVITEDPVNPELLFVGTEFAAFASVDGGREWHRIMNGLPTVAVHDLFIHPRDGDLIAATHGRSIWIMDDITPLQQLKEEVLTSEAHLFLQRTTTIWRGISRGAERGHLHFRGRNPLTITDRPPANSPPELQNSAFLTYYLKSAPSGDVRIEISDISGGQQRNVTAPKEPGINRYQWNLHFDPTELDREITRTTQQLGRARTDEDRQKILQEARAALPKLAETRADRDRVDRQLQLLSRMASGGFGGPSGGARGAQGPVAVPGLYQVKLTVGGQSYATILRIRPDPLFEEMTKK